MAGELQHCPECQEEYVAGVAACVECGGALQPGPLERRARRTRRSDDSAPVQGADLGASYRLLARMPGIQADHAVRTLLLEEITCRVECAGIVKTYTPGAPPAEPFAVTLPVSVFVSEAQHDMAQEVLASLSSDDLIGDQWSESEAERDDEDLEASDEAPPDEPAAETPDDQAALAEPAAESTSMRTVLLIVVAAIVLLFLFAR